MDFKEHQRERSFPPAFAEAATVLRHSGFATARRAGRQIARINADRVIKCPLMLYGEVKPKIRNFNRDFDIVIFLEWSQQNTVPSRVFYRGFIIYFTPDQLLLLILLVDRQFGEFWSWNFTFNRYLVLNLMGPHGNAHFKGNQGNINYPVL